MNTKNDKRHIEAKSLRERLLLKEYIFDRFPNLINVKYTDYQGKDKYDVIFDLKTTKETHIAEAKVRLKSILIGNGFYIQKDKYDYLMSRADEFDKVLYINFFTDGIIIYDLKTIDPSKLNWKEEELRKDNQNDDTKTKIVADLMVWDAWTTIEVEIPIHQALQRAYKIWDKRNNNE